MVKWENQQIKGVFRGDKLESSIPRERIPKLRVVSPTNCVFQRKPKACHEQTPGLS
jgi:hypothetical protein